MVQRILVGMSALAVVVALGATRWHSTTTSLSTASLSTSSRVQQTVPAATHAIDFAASDAAASHAAVDASYRSSDPSADAIQLTGGQSPRNGDVWAPPGRLIQAQVPPRNESAAPIQLPPAGAGAPTAARSTLPSIPSSGLRVPADGLPVKPQSPTGELLGAEASRINSAPSITPLGANASSNQAGVLSYSGVLSFVNDIPIPAQTDGIIQQFLVDEGSVVAADSVLIELDNRLAKAEEQIAIKELESATLKAEDDSQIKFSKASRDVAMSVFKRSQELYEEGVESLDDWEKKRLEKIKAEFQIDVSHREQRINQAAVGVNEAKLNAANVQLELRTLRAPFAGIVAQTKKERFEWVKAGEEIMRLVSLEKFRVNGSVRIVDSPNVLEGAPARVFIPIGMGKTEVVEGVVGFVKPESEGTRDGMHEYRVWVEIPNRVVDGKYLFRGSMDARVEIYPAR